MNSEEVRRGKEGNIDFDHYDDSLSLSLIFTQKRKPEDSGKVLSVEGSSGGRGEKRWRGKGSG